MCAAVRVMVVTLWVWEGMVMCAVVSVMVCYRAGVSGGNVDVCCS
jgi:hypothetical protein